MASEPLIRNGVSYITAKAAAPAAGIPADYITKLCRKGEVNAVVVGTTWYVDEASLADFVARTNAAKKLQAELNARELKEAARRARAAQQQPQPQPSVSLTQRFLDHKAARTAAFAHRQATYRPPRPNAIALASVAFLVASSAVAISNDTIRTGAAAFGTPARDVFASTLSELRTAAATSLASASATASATSAAITSTLSSEITNLASQLPALELPRLPDRTPVGPSVATSFADPISQSQLAQAATSLPQRVTQAVRNFFCRFLTGCDATYLAHTEPRQLATSQRPQPDTAGSATAARILDENAPDIGYLHDATKSENVNPAASSQQNASQSATSGSASAPARSASATPVAGSHASPTPASPASPSPISQPHYLTVSGITESVLNSRLLALETSLAARIESVAQNRANLDVRRTDNVADNLSRLTDRYALTFDTNALTADAASFDALTVTSNASVGDSLAVTNDATIGGDLTVAGTITGGTLAVAGLASGGAITAPYFTATSSSATSTFAGGIAGPGDFTVLQNGNVGIGTTAPTSAITIVGTSTHRTLEIHNEFAIGADLYTHGTAAFRAPVLNLYRSRGTQLSPIAVMNGDQLGYLQMNGYGANGYYRGVILQANAEGNWTESSGAANFAIYTNPSGSIGDPVERLRVTAGGNLGIASTSPYAKLSLTNTGTGPSFLVEDSASPDTTPFIIDASGNVGIGTLSPIYRLHIEGSSAGDFGSKLWNLDANGYTSQMIGHNGRALYLDYYNTSYSGSVTDSLFESDHATVFAGSSAAGLNLAATNASSDLKFYTGGYGPAQMRMRITPSGNVGIGTTNPGYPLSVKSFGTLAALESSTNTAFLRYDNSSTNAVLGLTNSDYTMTLGGSERIRITSSGNVGIGTTSPLAKLDIVGSGELFRVGGQSNLANIDGYIGFVPGNGSVSRGFVGYNATTNNIVVQGGSAKGIEFNVGNATFGSGNAAVITSTGNVGIGTTSPVSKFSISGSSFSATQGGDLIVAGSNTTGAGLTLESTDTGGRRYSVFTTGSASSAGVGKLSIFDNIATAHRLVIDNSGNVGIGLTGPAVPLGVNGAVRSDRIGAPTQYLELDGGGVAGPVLTAAGSNKALTIKNTSDGGIFFNTNGAGLALTVTNTGNVGIGTTSPSTKLHVSSSNLDTLLTLSSDTGSGTEQGILFTNYAGSATSKILFDWFGSNYGSGVTTHGMHYISGRTGLANHWFMQEDGTVQLAIKDGGNVGIGTTSPLARLSVQGAGTGTGINFQTTNSAQSPLFSILDNGNVGIGTTSPVAKLDIAESSNPLRFSRSSGSVGTWDTYLTLAPGNLGSILANGSLTFLSQTAGTDFAVRAGNSGNPQLVVKGTTGSVGIGTTSPWRKLSVTGTVGFGGLTGSTGAGSLCLSANNEVVYNSASDSCLSSTRDTKEEIDPLVTDALEQVLALNPVSFRYKHGDGRTRYGFIAEDAAGVDPHLATYDAHMNISGIDDRAILAILVGAIQDLARRLADLTERLVTKELLATRIAADEGTFGTLTADQRLTASGEVCGRTSGGDQVCLTADQFAAMLSQFAGAVSPASMPPPPSDPSEPGDQNPPPAGDPDLTDFGQSDPANWTPEEPGTDAPSPEASNDNQPPAPADTTGAPDAANDNAPLPTESAM